MGEGRLTVPPLPDYDTLLKYNSAQAASNAYNNSLGAAGNSLGLSGLNDLSNAAAQAQHTVMPLQGLAGATYQMPVQPAVSVAVGHVKVQTQIYRAIEQLPLSLAAKITSINFFHAHDDKRQHLVVTYTNGHSFSIEDVDNFPSDEHIARIALECP
jgi:hypothetical protein